MDSTRWSSTSFLGELRHVTELPPGSSYLLAPDRRLLHANVHALGPAGAWWIWPTLSISNLAARSFARRDGVMPRATEVFVLWMRNRSEGEIARELRRNIDTVRSHLKDIRGRSGLSSKVELMNAVRTLTAR